MDKMISRHSPFFHLQVQMDGHDEAWARAKTHVKKMNITKKLSIFPLPRCPTANE